MKRKLSIKETIYEEDIKRTAKLGVSEKLKAAIELSDFYRYLHACVLTSRGKK